MSGLPFSRLRELLEYDPETGNFKWLVRRSRIPAGAKAGSASKDQRGYVRWYIDVDGKKYLASRLAWFYMTGSWPIKKVDHRDRNSLNNRWENLREASHADNCRNARTRKPGASGIRGVSWHKATGKWIAAIRDGKKQRHLGLFADKDMAAKAYATAAQQLHGDFAYEA